MKGRRPHPPLADGIPESGPAPTPPGWLTGEALAEWTRVIPELTSRYIVSPVDVMTLAVYCKAYSEWRECMTVIERDGRTFMTEKGDIKLHPLARHGMALLAELRRVAEQFGFTPASRQRIKQAPVSDESDDFETFQNGQHNGGMDSHEVR